MSQTPVETWTESILLELTCMQKNQECEPASRVSIFWSTPLEKHKQTVSSLSKSPPHSLHLIFCLQKIIDWFLNLLKSVLKSSRFSTPFPNHWVWSYLHAKILPGPNLSNPPNDNHQATHFPAWHCAMRKLEHPAYAQVPPVKPWKVLCHWSTEQPAH